MYDRATRRLFTSATLFNWTATVLLLAAASRPDLSRLMGLGPVSGSNSLFFQISAAAVALFGWAYWQVSRDPVRNRPLIALGIVGKLATVALIWGHYLAGTIGWQLPALVIGDLIYATLFWRWLSRNDPVQFDQ